MAKKFKLTKEGRQLAKEYKKFHELRDKFITNLLLSEKNITPWYKLANICFYILYTQTEILDSCITKDYENLIKSGEWSEKALKCYIIINK